MSPFNNKQILKLIMNQVFITQWQNRFKVTVFESFEQFYDLLRKLSTDYDELDENTVKLTFSKKALPTKGNAGNGGTSGSGSAAGGSAGSAKNNAPNGGGVKKVPKCTLCAKEHYTFQQEQIQGAYKTEYGKTGDFIKWACPSVSNYDHAARKVAWDSKVKQVQDRWLAKKARAAKESA